MSDSIAPISPDRQPREAMMERVDLLEQSMMTLPAVDCPLRHTFTPGLYAREITMPAGSLITSKIHKTEHPFVISKGRVSVWMVETQMWEHFTAPHMGVTKPGTRRVLFVHEDTVWTTFHPTTLTTVEEIEAAIIEPHREHLAGMVQPTALPPIVEPAPIEEDKPCLG